MFDIRGEFDKLALASTQLTQQEYFAKEFGPRFQNLFTAPTTEHVAFVPSSKDVKVQARLMIDPEKQAARLAPIAAA